MTINGWDAWEMLKMAENILKWLEIFEIGWNCRIWVEMAGNGWKWLKMAENGWNAQK